MLNSIYIDSLFVSKSNRCCFSSSIFFVGVSIKFTSFIDSSSVLHRELKSLRDVVLSTKNQQGPHLGKSILTRAVWNAYCTCIWDYTIVAVAYVWNKRKGTVRIIFMKNINFDIIFFQMIYLYSLS